MRIVTAAEMKRLEAQADAVGYPYDRMMELAGLRVAEVAEQLLGGKRSGQGIVVLVGPGNNGGDGLVVARHLAAAGHDVHMHLVRPRSPEDPQWQAASTLGIPHSLGDDEEVLSALQARLRRCSLVVDALLGTGSKPPITGTAAVLLSLVRDSLAERAAARAALEWPCRPTPGRRGPTVLAVDLPSGMDADTGEVDPLTLAADITVTIGFPKAGLFTFPGAARVGRLVVADIGIEAPPVRPDEWELLTPSLVARDLPPRPRDGHKGTFGSVMVVAGSSNYVGAGLLAAAGAARAGCGLVTLASVSPVVAAADTVVPEATRLHLPGEMGVVGPDAVPVLRRELGSYQALLVGPGLTQEKPAAAFWERLLGGAGGPHSRIGFAAPGDHEVDSEAADPALPPMVVDADGLNLLAKHPHLIRRLPAGSVLTPHPGEMARLLGSETAAVQAGRLEVARSAAQDWGVVVMLKGAFTVVAAPDGRVCLSPFAGTALASAGSGDVLAGAVASLLAQGLEAYAAARVAVYLHGLAGELTASDMGSSGVLASDLLTYLPRGRAAVIS